MQIVQGEAEPTSTEAESKSSITRALSCLWSETFSAGQARVLPVRKEERDSNQEPTISLGLQTACVVDAGSSSRLKGGRRASSAVEGNGARKLLESLDG